MATYHLYFQYGDTFSECLCHVSGPQTRTITADDAVDPVWGSNSWRPKKLYIKWASLSPY